MVTTITKEVNGHSFKYTVSDMYYINKVGTDEVYSEAYDVIESDYTYVETDKLLEKQEEDKI